METQSDWVPVRLYWCMPSHKTHDAIKNYSQGDGTHDELLAKLKAINAEYLKELDKI